MTDNITTPDDIAEQIACKVGGKWSPYYGDVWYRFQAPRDPNYPYVIDFYFNVKTNEFHWGSRYSVPYCEKEIKYLIKIFTRLKNFV